MSAIISCDECPGLRDRGQNLLPSRCLSPSCRLSLTDTLFILRDQDQADVLVSQPLAFISSSLPSAVDASVGVFTRAVEEIGGNRNDSSITSLLLSLSDRMTYQTRWPIRLDDLLRHRWKNHKNENEPGVGRFWFWFLGPEDSSSSNVQSSLGSCVKRVRGGRGLQCRSSLIRHMVR